jgi:hypothetical protein
MLANLDAGAHLRAEREERVLGDWDVFELAPRIVAKRIAKSRVVFVVGQWLEREAGGQNAVRHADVLPSLKRRWLVFAPEVEGAAADRV